MPSWTRSSRESRKQNNTTRSLSDHLLINIRLGKHELRAMKVKIKNRSVEICPILQLLQKASWVCGSCMAIHWSNAPSLMILQHQCWDSVCLSLRKNSFTHLIRFNRHDIYACCDIGCQILLFWCKPLKIVSISITRAHSHTYLLPDATQIWIQLCKMKIPVVVDWSSAICE